MTVIALVPNASLAQDQSQVKSTVSAFTQAGLGDQHTSAYIIGLTLPIAWRRELSVGTLMAYAEISIGRWHTDGANESDTAWPTQISATLVLRIYSAQAPNWFADIGIGASYIVPLFHSGEKYFSTEFNFGDHVAVGRTFGGSEIQMRIEHFSNAGIDHPNPGENFMQLRYARNL